MNNQINIQTDKVLNAYKNASEEQKKLLENLFGKEVFTPKDITEHIKSFEDACEVLGEDHLYVQMFRDIYTKSETAGAYVNKDVVSYFKLRIITEALNQGWSPDWKNSNEYKYYPWFCLYTEEEYKELDEDDKSRFFRFVGRSSYNAYANGGLVYASAFNASSFSYPSNGSRLAFKTRELALYAGKQFINEWCDFLF